MTLESRDVREMTPEEFNTLFPVMSVSVYPVGMRLNRYGGTGPCQRKKKRGKIRMLSKRSLSNLIWTAANTSGRFVSMLTLTYGLEFPANGQETKRHLNKFLTAFRRIAGHFSYLWVLEFQGRGAPHFHVLTNIDLASSGYEKRQKMAGCWATAVLGRGPRSYCDLTTYRHLDLWSQMYHVHNHLDTFQPLWSKDGAIRYVTKYAAKLEQKSVPEAYQSVGRFWGASRDIAGSIKPLYRIPIASDDQLRKLLVDYGRDDLSDWEILPTRILSYLQET